MNTTVCFDSIESPLGTLRLVATSEGTREHLLRGRDGHAGARARLGSRPGASRASARGGATRANISPAADVRSTCRWHRPARRSSARCGKRSRRVPAGATISYTELARRAGHPGSFRAVGAATGRNPLAIVVPCHRIVGADGSLTGYAGGLARKRALLAFEGAAQAQLALAV